MSTDDKRWNTLNALLTEALQQPKEKRDAWVTATCSEDPALAAELRELLSYDAEETGQLAASIAITSAQATDSIIGTTIGSYRITGRIAEGGMGVVYRGEREGADFDQSVAVKVMHSHMFSKEAQARFVAERQILAKLNHPNIARLIDGGMTDDGLPYIVMEYIEGKNIADYCAHNKLDNESILRLVMEICDALQYAHNQLVIHRDIKPSNILVDSSGAPRLLDFGIAKLLQQDGSAGEQTQLEMRVLTPLYASPEQLGSQPVSTAADVYGVGLLLYRLLTGRLPYTPTSDHPRDVEKAILSSPAEIPSSAVTQTHNPESKQWSTRQSKALRGDLDTILLKSLRKEPERRYATVSSLNEDLERFLGQLPIQARRDTLAYRTNRFIARNRITTGLASLLAVTVIALTLFYTARLDSEREVAQQTADFLTGLFVDSNPYKRSRDQLTVATLVSSGADNIIENTALEPAVRARLLQTIADVLHNVSDLERAESLIIESLSFYEKVDAPKDHIKALGTLQKIRYAQGRYDDAVEIVGNQRALAQKMYGKESVEVAKLACQTASIHMRTGDNQAMYENVTFAMKLFEALLPADAAEFICAYNTLGDYYGNIGDARRSLELLEQGLALRKKHNASNETAIASAHQNLAISYIDLGDYNKAVDYLEYAIEVRTRLSGGTDYQIPLAMYSLAHAYGKLGRFSDAHRRFSELIELQIERTGENHDWTAYWLTGHGDLLANMGATQQADNAFQRASKIYTEIGKAEIHLDRSVTLIGHGKVARDRDDLVEAERLMQKAATMREKTSSKENTFTQLAYIDLADVLRRLGRLDDARSTFDAALSVLNDIGDSEHPTAAQALTGLARIELAEGRTIEAQQLLERAVAMTKESIGIDHLDNIDRRLLIADAIEKNGDAKAAEEMRSVAAAKRSNIMAEWAKALATDSGGL